MLIASAGTDELYGGGDDDALQGGEHDDHLEGNEGNDVLAGGAQRDVLLGGEGNDVLFGDGSYQAIDREWAVTLDPSANGGFGVVTLNEHFSGSDASLSDDADLLLAGAGDDYLEGGVGGAATWEGRVDGRSDAGNISVPAGRQTGNCPACIASVG